MSDQATDDPIDRHDAPGMAQWLRTRAQANRNLAQNTRNADGLIVLERWRENLLPHIAHRMEQAATLIENQQQEIERLRDAVQGLIDEQNGPPLLSRKEQWQRAYDHARAVLIRG